MKTYTVRGGSVTRYTEHELQRKNRTEGRRRLSGGELDGLIMAATACNILEQYMDDLDAIAHEAGVLGKIKSAKTFLRNCVTSMTARVEAHQLLSLVNNLQHNTVTISSLPVPAAVNIPLEDMLHICNRAMETCEMVCTRTREESKRCRTRAALDGVPGAKSQAKERARADASQSPYSGIEMEVEE